MDGMMIVLSVILVQETYHRPDTTTSSGDKDDLHTIVERFNRMYALSSVVWTRPLTCPFTSNKLLVSRGILSDLMTFDV